MCKAVLAVIGLGLGLGAGAVTAQQLQMTGASGPSRSGLPARGSAMAQVEQAYGAPSQRLAAVGRPAITRWVYPTFVVYFEDSLVIHAVAVSAAQPRG